MPTWDLILDGALDGALNMSVDSRLFSEVDSDPEPRTILRFYGWRRPTISLGRHQNPEAALDLEYCSARGIEWVHRPTGGRAVLHDDELTYAVISNDPVLFGTGVYENYRRISEALRVGLGLLGVHAVLAPETRKLQARPGGPDPPCFMSPSRYELTIDGRKIAGSAQRRGRRGFLQHGSLPLTCDREALARATRMTDPSLLDQEMAGLAEFLAVRPAISAVSNVLMRGFAETFGVDLRPLSEQLHG